MSSVRSSRWCCATSSFVANAGASAEWDDILRDHALTETAITYNGKTFVVRSNTVWPGRLPNASGSDSVRRVDDEKESADPSL